MHIPILEDLINWSQENDLSWVIKVLSRSLPSKIQHKVENKEKARWTDGWVRNSLLQ